MIIGFEQELAALQRFTELLEQEQAALVRADVDQLIQISQEKLRQADHLNQLARERVTALQSQGVTGDRASMESWLAYQPDQNVEDWKKLLDAARTAQHLNQTNGKLIEIQLQHNQQALNTLANAANRASVYGADGQPRAMHAASQRILGKG